MALGRLAGPRLLQVRLASMAASKSNKVRNYTLARS